MGGRQSRAPQAVQPPQRVSVDVQAFKVILIFQIISLCPVVYYSLWDFIFILGAAVGLYSLWDERVYYPSLLELSVMANTIGCIVFGFTLLTAIVDTIQAQPQWFYLGFMIAATLATFVSQFISWRIYKQLVNLPPLGMGGGVQSYGDSSTVGGQMSSSGGGGGGQAADSRPVWTPFVGSGNRLGN
eukprot:Trichotokara_eunicae@DN4731_c0_g1_i1.p1